MSKRVRLLIKSMMLDIQTLTKLLSIQGLDTTTTYYTAKLKLYQKELAELENRNE